MEDFIKIEEDKFEKKTIYSTRYAVKINSDSSLLSPEYGHYNAEFQRIVAPSGEDRLRLHIENWSLYSFKEEDEASLLEELRSGEPSGFIKYGRLEKGKVSILVDNDVIALLPSEFDKENCYYDTDRTTLQRICDAKSFEMKVSGRDDFSFELKPEALNNFQTYCKQCYNGFYDQTAYTDALNQSTSTKGGSKGGCLGVFVAILGFAGLAIATLSLFAS